jgi:signal transduction histidine kinase
MTQMLLGVCSGALAAIVGVLFLLQRKRAGEQDAVERALSACSLWWWQSDENHRVTVARAGRRRPEWLEPESLAGSFFWRIPGAASAEPAPAIAEAIAARRPFFDVPIAVAAGVGTATVCLSAVPRYGRTGRYCGYAGTASLGAAGSAEPLPDAIRDRLAQMEREREQERREHTRQFELAAKEMESFSYSVSHDLRAPLRVIDGFAGIVLEDYGARLDELGREHVKRITAAASRMNTMIDALLAMSRRTGRELDIEPVDLSRAARELAEELRAGDFSRAVEFRIEPDLRVEGDPVLLRLVLQNLLGNAFKFSANVPQALIQFGRHVVDGRDVYFLRDNGAGFDMRFAERLFGLFQRFHSQNEFPGTGVGLATVQRIVRKHGGQVWAESEPGKGACFYFTLARLAPRVAPAAE